MPHMNETPYALQSNAGPSDANSKSTIYSNEPNTDAGDSSPTRNSPKSSHYSKLNQEFYGTPATSLKIGNVQNKGSNADFVASNGKLLPVNDQQMVTRKVKFGRRVFEVTEAREHGKMKLDVNSNSIKEAKSPDRYKTPITMERHVRSGRGNGDPPLGTTDPVNLPVIEQHPQPSIPTEPIATRMPRKRRKVLRAPSSIISLPMSSVTAFSGFTSIASTSSIRPKRSKKAIFLNSLIMFGREFCYAVEASLTTPILLSIGLPINLYSLVWAISPLLGFVLQPVIGALSDRCKTRWGRRRPFILVLAILLLVGMTFFLNGEHIVNFINGQNQGQRGNPETRSSILATILVTVAGVVIFDFSADFIEGPIRAYIMDVCDEEDVRIGLFYQAILTGLGGTFGYASGGVSWVRDLGFDIFFPSDRQVVYVFAAVIFIITLALNLTSIPEKDRSKKTSQLRRQRRASKRRSTGKRKSVPENRKKEGGRKTLVTEENWNEITPEENNSAPRIITNESHADLRKYGTDKMVVETTQKQTYSPEWPHVEYVQKANKKMNKRGKKSKSVSKPMYGTFRNGSPHEMQPYIVGSDSNNRLIYAYPGGKYFYVDDAQNGYAVPISEEIYETDSHTAQWVRSGGRRGAYSSRRGLNNYRVPHEEVIPYRKLHSKFNPRGGLYTRSSDSDSTSIYSDSSDVDSPPNFRSQRNTKDSRLVKSNNNFKRINNDELSDMVTYEDFEEPYHPLPLHKAPTKNLDSQISQKNNAAIGNVRRFSSIESVSVTSNSRRRTSASPESLEKSTEEPGHGIKGILKSVVGMPKELKNLCIAHLLGWIAFLCVVLFFTDFVGQEVYGGDPQAPLNSPRRDAYKRGVEIGSWGMTINAAASCAYCFLLKPMIHHFGARPVYMFGYFAFCIGACGMALFQNIYCVLVLSSLIGVMSATLYTLPYFLVAQYHEGYKNLRGTPKERGAGTDCALVTCMIQLAQIIVGLGVGALVVWLDTVTVTVAAGSIVSFLGMLWVTFCIKY